MFASQIWKASSDVWLMAVWGSWFHKMILVDDVSPLDLAEVRVMASSLAIDGVGCGSTGVVKIIKKKMKKQMNTMYVTLCKRNPQLQAIHT